jgi:AraC family transcriptional regulator
MSAPRIWTAFLTASAGEYEHPGAEAHVLTIHARGHIEARIDFDGRSVRRRQAPGDIDFLPALAPAAIVDEGPNAILALALPAALLEGRAAGFGMAPHAYGFELGFRDAALADLAWRLHARREAAFGLYEECLSDELLRRVVWRQDGREADALRRTGALDYRRLRRVLERIEDELDTPILIGDLAAEAGVGPTAFKAAFRNAMGAPAHRYIVRRRAERARLLLLEGRLPASQVALEAGFSHQTHMARWLRRLFGILPSDLARAAVSRPDRG